MQSNLSKNTTAERVAQTGGSQMTSFDPIPPKAAWVLHVYQKKGDDLVEERPLVGMDVTTLQGLFGQQQDNPMYDAYPVCEAQVKRLQSYIGHPMDLQTYDYFVECLAG